MYLGIVETCSDPGLVTILQIVQQVFQIFQIIVPIIAIVALIKLLTQLVIDPENKKLKNGFKNWLMALLIFFFLPYIINAVMSMETLDENFSFASCWNMARENKNSDSTEKPKYDSSQEKEPTKLIK